MSECNCEALTVSCGGNKRVNLKAVEWEDVDLASLDLSTNRGGFM
jgi:hypothetical protein